MPQQRLLPCLTEGGGCQHSITRLIVRCPPANAALPAFNGELKALFVFLSSPHSGLPLGSSTVLVNMHVHQKMRTVVTAVAPLLLLDFLSPVAAQLSLATCENGFEWVCCDILQHGLPSHQCNYLSDGERIAAKSV